ncbi:general secretion pathway protein [Maribacter sp. PR1]|uniref:General secretion pathway protein n=1 Tax=Maribacter cobaltidurans TaxID=1178778 RepID=A0ABU7J0L1_9FLAO|nr:MULTISPECIES: general secretion pathway protein [Maribacter]MDC6390956.1 general secretion pathway protein [Maribacter sp. PR1]MEE1978348.1 hypothetical protein [Maribacter cobaltidurans]
MIFFLKIALLVGLTLIFLQDLKDREVWWFLFPTVGLLMGGIHVMSTYMVMTYSHILMNLVLITAILLILWGYTRFITKSRFLNVSFGLGDLLFFYAFALGFPTVTFIVLFVASILVSLTWSLIYLKKNSKKTIPLAGLMSSFLILVYTLSLFTYSPALFTF